MSERHDRDDELTEAIRNAGRALAEIAEADIQACGHREPAADHCDESCPCCGPAQRALLSWARANWHWSTREDEADLDDGSMPCPACGVVRGEGGREGMSTENDTVCPCCHRPWSRSARNATFLAAIAREHELVDPWPCSCGNVSRRRRCAKCGTWKPEQDQ